MSTARKMTSQSVKAIMNQRVLIPETAVSKRVKLAIQGNGNTIDVKDKDGNFVASAADPNLVLQKRIFNCKANSGLAMGSERNRKLLKDAIAAEKAGDADKAHELFNEYLNRVQLSFGILLPSAVVEKLASGVEIAASITKVTTENGSLLTIDPSTISVVEPETYGKTTFSLEDFAGDEDETPAAGNTVADVLNTLASLDREGLKKHIADNQLNIKVVKAMNDDQIRAAIATASVEEEA